LCRRTGSVQVAVGEGGKQLSAIAVLAGAGCSGRLTCCPVALDPRYGRKCEVIRASVGLIVWFCQGRERRWNDGDVGKTGVDRLGNVR